MPNAMPVTCLLQPVKLRASKHSEFVNSGSFPLSQFEVV